MIASLDSAGTHHRRQVAFMAFLLAMVLAWVGGTSVGVQHGDLGTPTDHGLAGAAAERAQADLLPAGKPSSEATSEAERSESEDDSEPILSPIACSQIEMQRFAAGAVYDVDATSAMRAWLLFANIGARGPPVG